MPGGEGQRLEGVRSDDVVGVVVVVVVVEIEIVEGYCYYYFDLVVVGGEIVDFVGIDCVETVVEEDNLGLG